MTIENLNSEQTTSETAITENISFEEALKQLEQIVIKLENGQMPLEEAVQAFTRGSKLKQVCEKKLHCAQLQINEISHKEQK